ncbi:MAG: autotransporter-associated beta strand repeat-containing protein [Planctomycetes bacterium]|nr:autotransporter-associated beta strand repeat-containing protein [Planctomycetota bacterium]
MALCEIGSLMLPVQVQAASQNWTGGSVVDGNWSTTANWSGGAAPGSTAVLTNTDVATFNAAIANTWGNAVGNSVVLDSATQNIGGISFTTSSGNYFIGSTGGNTLKLTSGGTLQILAGLTATNAVETINAPLSIQLANGSYTFANNSANGTGVGAGTLNFGGAISGAVAGTTTLNINGTNTNANTISGQISNGTATNLAVTKSGAGTWILSAANNYTGLTTVSAGRLKYGTNDVIAAGNVTINGASAVLDIGIYNDTVGSLTMSAGSIIGSGTLTCTSFAPSGTISISANLTDTGNVGNTFVNAPTLTLSGTNSFTNSGSQAMKGQLIISGGTTTFTQTGGTGYIQMGFQSTAYLDVTGGNLVVSSGGSANGLALGGNNNNAHGLLRLSSGSVSVGANTRLGLGASDTGSLLLSGGTATLAAVLTSGTGIVDVTGGTVSTGAFGGAANANFRGVSVSGGSLSVTSYGNLGTGSGTLLSGGQFTIGSTGAGTLSDSLGVFLTGGTLSASAISTPTLALSGVTIKTGTGASNLISNAAGAKVYTGGLTIDTTGGDATISTSLAGTTGYGLTGVAVNSGGNNYVDVKPTVNFSGGTGTAAMAYAAFSTSNNVAKIAIGTPGEYTTAPTSASLSSGNGTLGAISSALNSLGGLTKIGSGTLTLSSSANSYTGATIVNVGTLKSGASNALPDASAITVSGTGASVTATLDLNGNSDTIASLALGGSTTTSAAVVQTGGGTLTLGGNVTYSAANNPLGASISGNLNLGGVTRTFAIDDSSSAASDLSISAIISNGGLSKTGAGTQVLSGANNYAGTTTISGGKLLVNGSHTGGAAYNVSGTLGGSGSIASLITGSGLGSPGNSPGILTVLQTDPSGGMDFAFELTAPGDPTWSNAAASLNDVWRVTHASNPFPNGPFDSDNVLDIYFDSVAGGDNFRGGFFTDLNSNFLATVAGADYNYWVLGDGFGTDTTFDGQGYYSLANFDGSLSVAVSTVQIASANFSGGTVNNGWVMQFGVQEVLAVPEPGTLGLAVVGLIGLGFITVRRRRRA